MIIAGNQKQGQASSDQLSPTQQLYTDIKSYWLSIKDWSKLHDDLMSLPNSGRWAGVCESWHCSMWQQGKLGGHQALSIAKNKGWDPYDDYQTRIEALFSGHLTMAKAGDDFYDAQRNKRRTQMADNVKTGGVNVWDAWESRKLIG